LRAMQFFRRARESSLPRYRQKYFEVSQIHVCFREDLPSKVDYNFY
jgi:hypothetical protein